MSLADLLILGPAAFFAGMVDAVVGGGGLIQIPILLDRFPVLPLPSLFATNKIASVCGTAAACRHFVRKVQLPWMVVAPAALAALAGAWGGAALAARCPRDWMRPIVLALMIGALLYTYLRKDFGHAQTRLPRPADRWKGGILGLSLGAYDGFFGPGTGSFLAFAFVRLFGMDFLKATASAKLVNLATNLAALAYFGGHVPVLWRTGLVMAVCNLAGGQAGALLALKIGPAVIRRLFLLAVLALIARMAWNLFTN